MSRVKFKASGCYLDLLLKHFRLRISCSIHLCPSNRILTPRSCFISFTSLTCAPLITPIMLQQEVPRWTVYEVNDLKTLSRGNWTNGMPFWRCISDGWFSATLFLIEHSIDMNVDFNCEKYQIGEIKLIPVQIVFIKTIGERSFNIIIHLNAWPIIIINLMESYSNWQLDTFFRCRKHT